MKKKLSVVSALMLVAAIMITSLSACSLTGSNEETTVPFEQSASEHIIAPVVKSGVASEDKEAVVVENGEKEITFENGFNDKQIASIQLPESIEYIEVDYDKDGEERYCIPRTAIIICEVNSYAYNYAAENNYWYYTRLSALLDKDTDKVILPGTATITAADLEGINAQRLFVPASVTNVDKAEDGGFVISRNTAVYAMPDTFAESFAKKNGYDFYELSAELGEDDDEYTYSALFDNNNVVINTNNPTNSDGITRGLDGSEYKQNAKDIVTYFNNVISLAKKGTQYISFERSYSVDDIDIPDSNEQQEYLKKSLKQLRNMILDGAKANAMPLSEEGDTNITDGHIEYGSSKSKDFTVGELAYSPLFEDKEANTSVKCIKADALYRLTIALGNYNDAVMLDRVFSDIPAHSRLSINNEFNKLSDFIEISDDFKVETKDCNIYAEIARVTDELSKLELSKVYYITATVKGVGEFESYGTFELTFKFTDRYTYNLDWTAPVTEEAE